MVKWNIDRLKDKIEHGEMVIGTHVGFSNSCFTELLGDAGYDFIWIDSEHGALDRGDVQLHIIAARAAGACSIVRIPWNDPVMAKTVLDMGPDGIIFPMIRSAEEAKLAVSACLYPPKGIRGVGTRRANRYGMGDKNEYFSRADQTFWKIMQIEDVSGVENLDEILSVDGVDAIVVGPNDLAASAGFLGDTKDEKIKAYFDRIGETARKHDKPLGVSMAYDPEGIAEWLGRGIKWIGLGFDFGFVCKAAKDTIEGTRKIIGSCQEK